MNIKAILALAAFATVASTAVRADDADASQFAIQFQGSRPRAEVQAEAAQATASRSTEPAGSRVAASLKSSVDVQVVRSAAAEAVRLGRISRGELGPM